MTLNITATKTFHLVASPTIGSYILPGNPLDSISRIVDGQLKLSILPCNEIVDGVKRENFDLGLIESPIFDANLLYQEWMEDEIVVCTKKPLAISLEEKELQNCKLICRKKSSLTRMFINDFLKKNNLSYETFDSLSEIDNTTAIIQSVKWSKPNLKNPTIAFISKLAIEDELKYQELYQSRIYNTPIKRKLYIIYKKEYAHSETLKHIITELLQKHI